MKFFVDRILTDDSNNNQQEYWYSVHPDISFQ